MQHVLERQRYPEPMKILGFKCSACGQWWQRKPVSACPGVPLFYSWESAQAQGFYTKTQWLKQHRKLIVGAQPSAVKLRVSKNEWVWLYTEDQTEPTRTAKQN